MAAAASRKMDRKTLEGHNFNFQISLQNSKPNLLAVPVMLQMSLRGSAEVPRPWTACQLLDMISLQNSNLNL